MLKIIFPIITCLLILSASAQNNESTPSGLLCELSDHPYETVIADPHPEFSWIVPATPRFSEQRAYQILVASSRQILTTNEGDMWNSGKVHSDRSINVEYAGKPLQPEHTYFWTVRIWDQHDVPVSCASPKKFRLSASDSCHTPRPVLVTERISPKKIVQKDKNHFFIDFGKDAFGSLEIHFKDIRTTAPLKIHLGEKLDGESTIDRHPGGTIRYRSFTVPPDSLKQTFKLKIPTRERHKKSQAIAIPDPPGEVMPFRYVEIENSPCELTDEDVTHIAVHVPFDEHAASFHSSDSTLNKVWELCKYSIKATSFCGVYVDGDRERIPYEADAYINQLSHYAVDRHYQMARHSHEYLITHPTWPTEWIMHSVLMAYADYIHTGDIESIDCFYDDLKAKTLIALEDESGLVSTVSEQSQDFLNSIHRRGRLRDIVDWPPASFSDGRLGERDGYVMGSVNTVVNAFHYRSLVLMARMAKAAGHSADAIEFSRRASEVEQSLNQRFFDPQRGVYIDSDSTETHASLHANMFPLAFDMVPEEHESSVIEFIKSRGMACSVYGAQYLLEALFKSGEADYAIDLMTAQHDRSWPHMIELGSTITLEAWDIKYKNNLDWNHAWGAAPANIISRFVLGIQPIEPGWHKFRIKPQPGSLTKVTGKAPTIRGPVKVHFDKSDTRVLLETTIPGNTIANVYVPIDPDKKSIALVDGERRDGTYVKNYLRFDHIRAGSHQFLVRYE